MRNFVIRDFDPYFDWPGVLDVEKNCFAPRLRWTKRDYDRLLVRGGRCLVYEGNSVGVVGCCWYDDNEIVSIGVLAQFRHERIAERLMRRAAKNIRREGNPIIVLDVEPARIAALRLYLKLGFRPVSYRRPRGRGNGVIHMILMEKAR